MSGVLIITGDGAGLEAEYGLFRMREEGIRVTVAAPAKKALLTVFQQEQAGWDHGIESPWYPLSADAVFDDIDPTQYDGLLIPGGRAPVYLRNYPRCIEITQYFLKARKPISAICRGPILLVSAGAKGVRMTGHPLIRPRLKLGGCKFVDTRGEPVREGNIVTVCGPPYQHIWVREFLSLLRDPGRSQMQRSA